MDLHYFKLRIAQMLIHNTKINKDCNMESEEESDEFEPPQKSQLGRPGKVSILIPEARITSALHLPEAKELKEA